MFEHKITIDLYFDDAGHITGIGSYRRDRLDKEVPDEVWKSFEVIRDQLVEGMLVGTTE